MSWISLQRLPKHQNPPSFFAQFKGHSLNRQYLHLNVTMAPHAATYITQKRVNNPVCRISQYWGINGRRTIITTGKEYRSNVVMVPTFTLA